MQSMRPPQQELGAFEICVLPTKPMFGKNAGNPEKIVRLALAASKFN
jgi:hypothetical protein